MAECAKCGADTVLSLQNGKLLEVETGEWKEHFCPPSVGTVRECSCEAIVLVDPDGSRRDWPSLRPHAPHKEREARTGVPQTRVAERKELARRAEKAPRPVGLDL